MKHLYSPVSTTSSALSLLPFLLLMLPGVAWSQADLDGVYTSLLPDDPQITAQGKAVYAEHCAACHGENLEGQTVEWWVRDEFGLLPAPPHDDSGHTWHHGENLLFEIVKYGTGKIIGDETYESNMPIYEEELSDAQIIAVLSYIKSSWSDEMRDANDRRTAGDREYFDWQQSQPVKDELKGD